MIDISIAGRFLMGFAYGAVVGMLAFWLGLVLAHKEESRHRLKMRDCDLGDTECEKHHLPSDCPLCGAD